MASLPEYHVLNFFTDDCGSSALTVYAKDTRYHVIVDNDRLTKELKSDHPILREYQNLVERSQDEDLLEERGHDGSAAKEIEDEVSPASTTHDSGVDLSLDEDEQDARHRRESAESADEKLQDWIMKPLAQILETASKREAPHSVQDWYHCKRAFYQLTVEGCRLVAQEEKSSEELEQRMEALIPDMPLPKYIRDLQVDMIAASDVTILAESTEVEPIHPAVVEVDGTKQFLKVVDMNQTQPTKREISIMKRIEKKGLHKEIRIPLVRGLVHFEGKKDSIMGFLMDAIKDPKPLTHMLDPKISQSKRDRWAKEADRIVQLLHDNGIIWGDSKADNFMVDADENLWIIDFGGSYTDGWVDPELKETKEGDRMGIDKITNALHDPKRNTFDPAEKEEEEAPDAAENKEEQASGDDTQISNKSNGKRKRSPLFVTNIVETNQIDDEASDKKRVKSR